MPAFITEEQRENSAFLVGHLSSVLVERPAISIIKTTNDQDVTSTPGPYLSTGNTVNWKYNIQNIGNVDLTNVTVVDNPAVVINCNGQTTLASGAQMTCTATGVVTAGQFSNTATVTGTHSTGTVTASDTSWYFGTTCGDHVVQGSEQCDGGACCDNTCHFASSGSVCRAANGSCDTAEVCSGASAACPTDSFKPAGTSCSDGSFCNGNEQCNGAGSCLSGNVVDCSANNITGINSCDNDPDNNPFTKDTRDSFNSVCSETTQSCTVGDSTIFHQVPTVGTCGVECNSDSNCLSSEKVCNIGTHQCVNSCGNNIKESWEQCDGSAPEHYSCNSQCKLEYVPYCGDGNTDAGETCDDGANNGKYGYCNLTCNGRSLHCGDNIVTLPEECDGSEPSPCSTEGYPGTKSCDNLTCGWGNCLTTKKCGDGVVNGMFETCDDGDNNGKYGYCNSTCTAIGEFCGDKTINGAEECDGSAPEHYSCTHQCKLQYIPYCGDGIKNLDTEECDDGDTNNTNLCSNSCKVNHQKITLCHATPVDTATNGWNSITIDDDGIFGDAHDSNHSADIIPNFNYYKNGILTNYSGKNLTNTFFGFTGQQILNNGCKIDSVLKVVKIVKNDNGGTKSATDFKFSLNGGLFVNFGIGGSNVYNLKVGDTYSIIESSDFNNSYQEVSRDNCSGTIDSTQEVCIITNDDIAPKLKVIKQVFPTNDSGKFNLLINNTLYATNVGHNGETGFQTVTAGTVNFSETAGTNTNLSDYTTTYSSGCANGQTTLAAGESKTCIITNTRNTGSIKVNKYTDLDGDGNWSDNNETSNSNANSLGFRWKISGGSNKNMGDTLNNLNTGNYNIEEIIPGNYHFVAWFINNQSGKSCSNPNGTTLPISLPVTKNSTSEITLCNSRDTGTIIVHKDVQGPNGENITDTSTNFDVRLDGSNNKKITDGNTVTYSNVTTGDHSITEYNPSSNYVYYSISNDRNHNKNDGAQITVNKDQTVDVYITNRQKKAEIKVYKDVRKPNGSDVSDNHSFTIQLNGGSNRSLAENDDEIYEVNPGSGYTISELDDINYDEKGCKIFNTNLPATNLTLTSNQEIKVICTNWQKNATINVIKNVLAADGDTDVNDNYVFKTKLNGSNEKSFSENITATYSVEPGSYNITENPNSNYIYLGCSPDNNKHHTGAQLTASSNQVIDVVCTNKQLPASITIEKDASPRSETDFEFTRSWGRNFTLDDDGNNHNHYSNTETFDDLNGGSYTISEKSNPSWYLDKITCTGNAITEINKETKSVTIIVKPGENSRCVFSNNEYSSISGYKWEDLNANKIRDKQCEERDDRYDKKHDHHNDHCEYTEPTLDKWTINLYQGDSLISTTTTDDNGNYHFDKLTPGDYRICEDERTSEGWHNTNDGICRDITIQPGDDIKDINFGNQRLEPKTTITKSNNSGGVELSPGSSVEYTINVGFSDNSVNNLKVTDLLSNGFKYKSGSYKVYKNGVEVTSQVVEPQYHSPGIWDLSLLGKLSPEDQIKLVYIADISTDQQAGKYADLAWSIANYAFDSNKTVLALAGSEGHVDTNFVGTQVAVGGNYQNSVSAEVKQENHVTGQVLGASTELPGTGAATIWIIISGLLGLAGFSFLKFNKKTMLTILLTLLSFGLITSPVRAETSNLSVRLEEPKTPSRIKEIELKYVALDIQGRGVTAYCLKKGPTDSGFVEFSSETLSGTNGNASHCSLASAITDNGSYQFQVKAVAGGEESLSNLVSLDYNTSSPGTPIDYRKEQINSCDFKIHFKTADDSGKTVKVELYRSTDSNFSANNESLVVSTDIGSNQEKDIWNNVPDCSKIYYFALRAFDSAGNGSGLVGDKVYTIVTDGSTTITSTTTNSGAIPVSGAVIPKEGEGDQINPDTTQQEGTGQVLGTRTVVKDFFSRHPITTILIAVLILGIIIYAFKKIRQGKKIVVKKRK